MKRIVEDTEGGNGLEALLGEQVLLLCSNYFYAGKLVGVNADHVELSEASIVYETGKWADKGYLNAERLPGAAWRVRTSFIESYGLGK